MASRPISSSITACFRPAIFLVLIGWVLYPVDLAAQGQPVQNGPMFPLGLWVAGACVLGLVIAYGILRNRTRTRADKQVTDQGTKNLYAKEERDRKRTGSV